MCGAAVTAEGAASSWCEKDKLVLFRMMCLEPTNNDDFISKNCVSFVIVIVYHIKNGSYKTNLASINKNEWFSFEEKRKYVVCWCLM